MEIVISSFYKYVNLDNYEKFQKENLEFALKLGIRGKVLVAKEGINGVVSGTAEQIKKYEEKLLSYKEFSGMSFKRNIAQKHPFRKTVIRKRNEIVTSKFDVDVSKTGYHLTPKELHELYSTGKDFVIVDARNNYESKIGKFKDAITPDIKTFKDFTKVANELEKFKDKKVVLYCTGGVRCEKASSLLIKKGFKDVNQLNDGIINYIEQYPDTYFEGRCFVFDDRLSIPSGKKNSAITVCESCQEPSGEIINCINSQCNKLIIICSKCKEAVKYTCSKECRHLVHTKAVKAAPIY